MELACARHDFLFRRMECARVIALHLRHLRLHSTQLFKKLLAGRRSSELVRLVRFSPKPLSLMSTPLVLLELALLHLRHRIRRRELAFEIGHIRSELLKLLV